MTGAAVVWFLGRRRRESRPQPPKDSVNMKKPQSLIKAQQAVRDSEARADRVIKQRGAVTRLVDSLTEIRENNHFGENIRQAMGGDR